MERPFVFSKVPEAETGGEKTVNRSVLGIISLKIKRVKRVGEQQSDQPRHVPDRMQGPQKVGDHCIGFGQERQTWLQHPKTYGVQPYDKRNPGSYVTFTFRYRSPDFLQAQGIIASLSEIPKFTPEELNIPDRSSANSPMTPRPTPSPKSTVRILSGSRRSAGTGPVVRSVSSQSDEGPPDFNENIFVWSAAYPTTPDPTNPYLPKKEEEKEEKEDDSDGDKEMTDDTEQPS